MFELSVEVRKAFDPIEFVNHIQNKKPILYKNVLSDWPAFKKWRFSYFKKNYPSIVFDTKIFSDKKIKTQKTTMRDYVNLLEKLPKGCTGDVPYCHDVPIFLLCPELTLDVSNDMIDMLPNWYRSRWTSFSQFFMSYENSVTPLHFDTLVTNNLFFQIYGKKKFMCIDRKFSHLCSRRGWRWFDFDLKQPEQVEVFRQHGGAVLNVDVCEGDMFYIPPGMLHHVQSITNSISFNIDYHTIESVFSALLCKDSAMPADNVRYNKIIAKALLFGDPENVYFEQYKSYMNYIS